MIHLNQELCSDFSASLSLVLVVSEDSSSESESEDMTVTALFPPAKASTFAASGTFTALIEPNVRLKSPSCDPKKLFRRLKVSAWVGTKTKKDSDSC